jgi:hypothetical protein
MERVRLTEEEVADLMAAPLAFAPWVRSISRYDRREEIIHGSILRFG